MFVLQIYFSCRFHLILRDVKSTELVSVMSRLSWEQPMALSCVRGFAMDLLRFLHSEGNSFDQIGHLEVVS